jgi:hypothetical protein
MPETPDFAQLAHRLLERVFATDDGTGSLEPSNADRARDIIEQLRLVWNARGAADLAKIEIELTTMMGATAGAPLIKNLDRALRKLDR